MIFDYILLEQGMHWISITMFTLSLAVYFFNLQYFIKKQFKYDSNEALVNNTTFQNAIKDFGPNTYTGNNPADKGRSNLELYKNPETLKLQAELEKLAETGFQNLKPHGRPDRLGFQDLVLDDDNNETLGDKAWVPLMQKDNLPEFHDSSYPQDNPRINPYGPPQNQADNNPFNVFGSLNQDGIPRDFNQQGGQGFGYIQNLGYDQGQQNPQNSAYLPLINKGQEEQRVFNQRDQGAQGNNIQASQANTLALNSPARTIQSQNQPGSRNQQNTRENILNSRINFGAN
jgi:hypothetical protein